jgi:carbonic anhydrase
MPQIHGWVFDVGSGKLIDLKIDMDAVLKSIKEIYNLTGE